MTTDSARGRATPHRLRAVGAAAVLAAAAFCTPAAAQTVAPPLAPHVPFPAGSTKSDGIPPSTVPLTLHEGDIDRDVQSAIAQTQRRTSQILVGSGELSAPDMGPMKPELLQIEESQRRQRLLIAKKQEADLAVALYQAAHDPKKEAVLEQAAQKRQSDEDRGKAKSPGASIDATQDIASKEKDERAAPRSDLPLPKVFSVLGGGGSALLATLLVPYVGQVDAHVGTVLPGHRKVISIRTDGVTVEDPKMGAVVLGYGVAVPLYPPTAIAPAPQSPGGPLAPPGFANFPGNASSGQSN